MALSFAVQSGDLMQVLSHRVLERLRRPLGRREHQLSAQVLVALCSLLTEDANMPCCLPDVLASATEIAVWSFTDNRRACSYAEYRLQGTPTYHARTCVPA